MEGLERRMGEFYGAVAAKFTEPDDVRIFWESLAQQESVHATVIQTLSNMNRNNPSMFTDFVKVDQITIDKIEEFIKGSEGKIESEDFDLDAAFKEAYELETLEINEIYDRIIQSPSEPFKAVISHLVDSEDAHLNSLVQAILKYASSDELKKKAENLRSSLSTH